MSNQYILWISLVVPWFTLLLMNKDDRKRFMPAALFTAFSSGIIYQLGIVFGFWGFREVAFPVVMYGPLPVVALWVLKFNFGQVWRYILTNAIVDLGFAFVLFPLFSMRDIIGTNPRTGLVVYAINFVHSLLIYSYQMWQEGRIRA
ncbi:MAG: hypothetical protein ACM3PP_06750 [Candidatus Saccharibacteria bacterium]